MKRINYLLVALLLIAFVVPIANAQKLAPEEQRIVNYVDAHKDEAIALLERVVNIESATQNTAGVKQVGQVFQSEFESIGLTARWLDMPPEMNRGGHLLAENTNRNARGKCILLLGHIDTVLQGEHWRREGDKAFGNGTSDMKGGDVVLL